MAEEIAVEKGQISNLKGIIKLTMALDWVILHTVVDRSLTSTYTPNFIEIKETFCGQTGICMHVRTARTHACMHGQTHVRTYVRAHARTSETNNQHITW